MKPASVLLAVAVAVALYLLVFERDRVLSLAGRQEPEVQTAETTTESEPGKVSVVVIDSTARRIDNVVPLRGETEALRQVDVRAQTQGLVTSEPLRKGHFVKSGETLCKVDPGTRPAQLAQAKASLAEARISDTAAAQLAEGGFGSKTRAIGAKATLQAAQAAVGAAETEMARLTITAPFEGLLESDTAELGSLLQPGSLCATIIQLDPIKIVGYLPEPMLDKVKVGAPAQARLGSGRNIAGRVTFLSRSADESTRTFRVEIEADNTDLAISDGQTAEIAIASEGVLAHRIPSSALTLDDDGTMGLRIVDDTGTVRFKPVQLIRDTPDGVVLTGLPDEARVIVVGQEYVSDGVEVIAKSRESGS